MSSQPAPTRTLSDKPSLVQLRKQAKDLLRSYRAGEEPAVAEVERFERRPEPARFKLADAQRVLARAYGFASWTELKAHIEGLHFPALLAAVEAGDVETVRRIAAARPELVNEHAPQHGSPLHHAVLRRDVEMTRVLMQLGADARVGIWPHRDATTAHAMAVDREDQEFVTIIESEEELRRTRLSVTGAASPRLAVDELRQAIVNSQTAKAVALLESDPALIGTCDLQGLTPLHLAAARTNPELVRWLLDQGASVEARNLDGKTALEFAAVAAGVVPDRPDVIFYFMPSARLDSALFDETARLLLARVAELTPPTAIALGDREAVLRFHASGRLQHGSHDFGLLAVAVRMNRLDMVTLLLDLGLDPNEPVKNDIGVAGWPLWFAAMCGRLEIAELLLKRGANVNIVVGACGDAMGRALDKPMQELLLKYGAHLTVEQLPEGDQGRELAREILAGTRPGFSLNVDHPTITDLAEQLLWATGDPEIVRMCLARIERPLDDPWWNYVLISTNDPAKLQVLLLHGVDPNVRSGEGYTPLHLLARLDKPALALAKLLLDAGASLTIRDALLNSTPLGWACRWGHVELVRLYLQRGADAVEADAEPWARPLAWARKRGHAEITQLLHAAGERE